MRIAIVTTNRLYPWGGAEHLWHAVALAARARRWPVLAVAGPLTLDSAPIGELRAAGVEVRVLPPSTAVGGGRLAALRAWRQRFLGARRGVGRALRDFAPDAILVSQCGAFDGAWEPWLQGVIAATGAPYVTITHNNDGQTLGGGDRVACLDWCRRARLATFVSAELADLAVRQLGVDPGNLSVVQNPVAIPATPPPWPASPPYRLAVVGRLEAHEKGLDLALAATAAALSRAEGWELSLHGRGPDAAMLRAQADQLGIGDRVRLAGYTPDPVEIWRHHHLCVLASRWEGFSLVMAEAMACGRPVLRTASGGANWIEPGRTGWLCAPGQIEALTAALGTAWARRADWASMGAAARAALLSRLDRDPATTLLDLLATCQSPAR
ncbi:MAG: glycosyltransferase [Opitutaceae bacterium]|nr:glycosyltransferase [Opitutaceae bacterium]